jgi:translation initiation factor 1
MIVFSTNPDFHFDEPQAEPETLAPERQKLRVSIERKGRGGKTATLVRGFVGSDDDLQALAKQLKTRCGTGGSAKEGEIIIQGEVKDKVVALLLSLGYSNSK